MYFLIHNSEKNFEHRFLGNADSDGGDGDQECPVPILFHSLAFGTHSLVLRAILRDIGSRYLHRHCAGSTESLPNIGLYNLQWSSVFCPEILEIMEFHESSYRKFIIWKLSAKSKLYICKLLKIQANRIKLCIISPILD